MSDGKIISGAVLAAMFSSCPGILTDVYADGPPSCHVEVTTNEPEVPTGEILTAVKFRYLVRHDEACLLHVIASSEDSVVCQKPSVEAHPTGNPAQIQSVVDVQCVYRRYGHFHLAPVYFEVQRAGTDERTAVYPKMPHVIIRGGGEGEPSALLHGSLALIPWRQRYTVLWAIFLTLSVSLCAAWVVYYRRSVKEAGAEAEGEEALEPIQAFHCEMALLVEVTPVTLEEYKAYHDRLSHAMRVFLLKRFSLDMSLTTAQLTKAMRADRIPAELCDTAERLLGESDYVKFALNAPSQADNLLILRDMGTLADSLERVAAEREEALLNAQNAAKAEG